MSIYTTSNGAPVSEPYAAHRAGINGPLLLQGIMEAIPPLISVAYCQCRKISTTSISSLTLTANVSLSVLWVISYSSISDIYFNHHLFQVHAKGAGAHGYFEVTHDLSDITSQTLFSSVGKKVRATVRFSTVGGENGSADTARDPRGFAIKLKTEEGNLDWVFNNTPVFFIRDAAKFPHFIHTQKRNPQSHLKDADMFWVCHYCFLRKNKSLTNPHWQDYLSQNPESIHQILILFSDRGTPDGYHQQHGYSGHTFKWLKDDGSFVYVQVHVRADGGFKVRHLGFFSPSQNAGVHDIYISQTLDDATAGRLAGENPDYGIEKLFNAIESGEYPSWTVYIVNIYDFQLCKGMATTDENSINY